MAKSKARIYEDTTLYLDVQKIVKNSKGSHLYDYKGTIHTPVEDVGVWDIRELETERNYKGNIGGITAIKFRVGLGDYMSRIYPHRYNLEFTLVRKQVAENGGKIKSNVPIKVRRYKLIFNPDRNPPVAVSDLQMIQTHEMNLVDMPELQVELLDRGLEPLRIKMTSGIFHKQNVENYIRATLGHESQQIRVDGKPVLDALDIVPPDNVDIIDHINIPDGTHLSSVPTMIQESQGVYNGAIGTYYQDYMGKKTWFVYPLYAPKRFDEVERKAVFYAVPQDKLPQLDRSYWMDGNVLKIAVTAQRMYKDSAELSMMNMGSGYRMTEARSIMSKPCEITEDGPIANRSRLNHEVVTKTRDDGVNYAPKTQGASSNPFMQRSTVLAHSTAQIDLVWENGDEELIYPGMPCKYVYLSQGEPISLKGTILYVFAQTTSTEKKGAQAYKTMLRLSIACEVQEKIPELEYIGVQGEKAYA